MNNHVSNCADEGACHKLVLAIYVTIYKLLGNHFMVMGLSARLESNLYKIGGSMVLGLLVCNSTIFILYREA